MLIRFIAMFCSAVAVRYFLYAVICITVLFQAASTPAFAAPSAGAHPFRTGGVRFSAYFGGATAFHQDYSIFGMGVGYFIADGLELGLDIESWFGNAPNIRQISPQIRVVLNTGGLVKPYAGAFYRRSIIDGYRDTDTTGMRVGAYLLTGRNVYWGAGLAHETHLQCDKRMYSSCSETFPELQFAIVF